MNVLIVCQHDIEADALRYAIKCLAKPKHTYKVVCCGEGETNAACMTSLEVNADVTKYDCIVSAGWAYGPLSAADSFVVPSYSSCWDVDDSKYVDGVGEDKSASFLLRGVDAVTILSGEAYPNDESVAACVKKYGKDIIFDTITFGVVSVAEDYGIATFAVKKVLTSGTAECTPKEFMPEISYIESFA